MPTTSFPHFALLPTELRLAIWTLCLPGRRVFELDSLQTKHQAVLPAGVCPRGGGPYLRELSWPHRGLTPVIAHVCREAREVASNHARHHHAYVMGEEGETDDAGAPYPPWTEFNATDPVRFRRGLDVVHLNWANIYGSQTNVCWVKACPLPTFQWLANQAAAASVTAELLAPFKPGCGDPHDDFSATLRSEQTKYFSRHVFYYVVLTMVEIHMSDDDAARAGVFGVLGEEPLQLVDPSDTAALARFRDARRGRQAPLEEPDIDEFFSRAIDHADVYRDHVDQWRRQLEDMWLRRMTLDPVYRPGWQVQEQIFDGDWWRGKANREHPWVQSQLAQMPHFEPAVMFRHCADRCDWAQHARSQGGAPSTA